MNQKLKLSLTIFVTLGFFTASGILIAKDGSLLGPGQNFFRVLQTFQSSLSAKKIATSGISSKKKSTIGKYAAGQVIVKFKEGTDSTAHQYTVQSVGGSVNERISDGGHTLVDIPSSQSVEDAVTQYSLLPNVEYAQPNFIYHTAATVPNDTNFGQQWSLHNTGQTIASPSYLTNNPGLSGDDMDMEHAWDISTDCSNTVVAVVDSGVNYNHEDLTGNIWSSSSCVSDIGFPIGSCSGYDYADNDKDPMDLAGHGTHVAGTIGAKGNNSTGVSGICWTATIMPVRVLNAVGQGTTANIAKGINFAVRNGAKVINMSLGGPGFDITLDSAIVNAGTKYDALVIVAAGNDGVDVTDSSVTYPCASTAANLLCIGALDQSYALAAFSNWDTTNVDIGAPGTNIKSTWAGQATSLAVTDFSTWTFSNSSVATGASWGASSCLINSISYTTLLLPNSCYVTNGSGAATFYNNNVNSYAYTSFAVPAGTDAVSATFYTFYNTETGVDGVLVGYKSGSSNPFLPFNGNLILDGLSGTDLSGSVHEYELRGCKAGQSCSFGFNFTSDFSVVGYGAGIVLASWSFFDKDVLNQYNTIDGTSMATPHVTGLATLIRSFNPQFTYQDTINLLTTQGDPLSLSSKLKYNLGADGYKTLGYLPTPAAPTVATIN